MRLYPVSYYNKSQLGFIDELAKGFVSGAAGQNSPAGAPGGAGGGANVSTATTISPTFQQSFTPQVSPVIQVSSGGGSQTAAAIQDIQSGQTAKGGGMLPPPPPQAARQPAPMPPTYATDNNRFYDDSPSFVDDYKKDYSDIFKENEPGIMGYLPWIFGGVILIGGAAILFNKDKKKK